MARKPGFYVHQGWYCTSTGGVKNRKLCPVEDGERNAEIALARLLVAIDDAKKNGGRPASTEVGPVGGTTSPLAAPVKVPSVPDALNDFMTFAKSEVDPATLQWYEKRLWPIYERFADWPVNKLTYEEGLKYKTWLREEKEWRKGKKGKLHKGLNSTTVNQYLRAARIFLGWCCKPSRRHRYGMSVNPWEEISYLHEKPRERLLTQQEMQHLLDSCTDGNCRWGRIDYQEQLVVLRHTSMRPGELRMLRWDYIQWDLHRIVYPSPKVKTRRRREVTMSDQTEEVLLRRKARLEAAGLKLTGRLVFPGPGKLEGKRTAGVGEKMQSAAHFSQKFSRLLARCIKKGLIEKEVAGERLVPYSTRHTRCTELFVLGLDQASVMFEMGHTNSKTLDRYTHMAASTVAGKIRAAEARAKAAEAQDKG